VLDLSVTSYRLFYFSSVTVMVFTWDKKKKLCIYVFVILLFFLCTEDALLVCVYLETVLEVGTTTV